MEQNIRLRRRSACYPRRSSPVAVGTAYIPRVLSSNLRISTTGWFNRHSPCTDCYCVTTALLLATTPKNTDRNPHESTPATPVSPSRLAALVRDGVCVCRHAKMRWNSSLAISCLRNPRKRMRIFAAVLSYARRT